MDSSELAKRMKTYENVSKGTLIRRTPVAIRIDGRSFHTFTKGFHKPFDTVLIKSMQETMKYLCENIQNCVLGYTQSDEITLILIDYKNLNTDAWFDNEVQKICSISASMATMAFNRIFAKNVNEEVMIRKFSHLNKEEAIQWVVYHNVLLNAVEKGAMFDSRCFNIPKEEVTNLIYWRQLDATRNSIQMVGQANFSHKELQGKSCNDIQDMLLTQKNINWNNFSTTYKRGSCCKKFITEETESTAPSSPWQIDNNIPIFKNEGRKYIDELVNI